MAVQPLEQSLCQNPHPLQQEQGGSGILCLRLLHVHLTLSSAQPVQASLSSGPAAAGAPCLRRALRFLAGLCPGDGSLHAHLSVLRAAKLARNRAGGLLLESTFLALPPSLLCRSDGR